MREGRDGARKRTADTYGPVLTVPENCCKSGHGLAIYASHEVKNCYSQKLARLQGNQRECLRLASKTSLHERHAR
jgi:hypothetical protein